MAIILQVASAQKGKSRLTSLVEEAGVMFGGFSAHTEKYQASSIILRPGLRSLLVQAFDTCDDYLVQKAKEMVVDYPGAAPVMKTLSILSFTLTEFFHRCSSEWQQVDWNTGIACFLHIIYTLASTPMKRIRNRFSHSIQSIVCIPHSPHSMHLSCIVKEMRAMDFLIASGSGGERWQGLDRTVHRSTWWPCGRQPMRG